MLHDESHLVVVVVTFYQSLWLKIHYYRTVKKTFKNLTIILPNSLKRTQIYIA